MDFLLVVTYAWIDRQEGKVYVSKVPAYNCPLKTLLPQVRKNSKYKASAVVVTSHFDIATDEYRFLTVNLVCTVKTCRHV